MGVVVLTPLYAWITPAARREPEKVQVHVAGSETVARRQYECIRRLEV